MIDSLTTKPLVLGLYAADNPRGFPRLIGRKQGKTGLISGESRGLAQLKASLQASMMG
jgi:hypothetical protein